MVVVATVAVEVALCWVGTEVATAVEATEGVLVEATVEAMEGNKSRKAQAAGAGTRACASAVRCCRSTRAYAFRGELSSTVWTPCSALQVLFRLCVPAGRLLRRSASCFFVCGPPQKTPILSKLKGRGEVARACCKYVTLTVVPAPKPLLHCSCPNAQRGDLALVSFTLHSLLPLQQYNVTE